ncbi:hypothetical protein SAY86_017362 [Trapa natans]|uniref:NAC domain-containing protein n=1 Tax=Trapa natans TaxID=22666 RepID=A0AAN7M1E6_TRANT|nr:hypothetical protein SAY86_017362 [Trapa natans]
MEKHSMRVYEEEEEEEEEEETALPGFRFYPTDEELLGFYLRRKVEGQDLIRMNQTIRSIDIYKYDPWDLPKSEGDEEWYFFCMRGRKYKNSVRPNRVTGSGFWKATGIDKPVYSSSKDTCECIGLKKSLVYYRGSAGKGTKTDWMMHEFRLLPAEKSGNSPDNRCRVEEEAISSEVWTICRVFKRTPRPTLSKCVDPNKKGKKHDAAKQTLVSTAKDSTSKSCSFDSCYGEHWVSLGDCVMAQQSDNHGSAKYLDWEPYSSFWEVGEMQII